MKLLKVRKAFLKRLTLLTVYLTVIIALVYHLFIPDRYFLWFPAIPVYYYLCGLFYVYMFETSYRMGEKKLITAFLVCKVSKFILSAFILMFYGFVVGHLPGVLLRIPDIGDAFLLPLRGKAEGREEERNRQK